jgi:hypothetical protein
MDYMFLILRISLSITLIRKEIQDVVLSDVEAPAPCRSIRARHATKTFTLLTMEHHNILLLDNNKHITYTEAMVGLTMRNELDPWNRKYNLCMIIKFGTWLIQSIV